MARGVDLTKTRTLTCCDCTKPFEVKRVRGGKWSYRKLCDACTAAIRVRAAERRHHSRTQDMNLSAIAREQEAARRIETPAIGPLAATAVIDFWMSRS